jgi:hypothetical protein
MTPYLKDHCWKVYLATTGTADACPGGQAPVQTPLTRRSTGPGWMCSAF